LAKLHYPQTTGAYGLGLLNMKIHCNRAELYRGVQTIQSALSPRTTLPILLNFLIETEDSKVKLVSTDLQMGVKHYIAAEIEKPGGITVPAKKFSDIIQSLPDDQDVDLSVDAAGRVHLTSGKSKFNIAGAPKAEYPAFPEPAGARAFSMPLPLLDEMVRKTVFAASTDETRHMLNGVFWTASSGVLCLVATDGRRLAVIKKPCLDKGMEFGIIVPNKVLLELVGIMASLGTEAKGGVRVEVTENQIAFQLEKTTIVSRLVEGHFPNYEQVIPSRKDVRVEMDARALMAITKRAALCAVDRGGSVRYTFKSGGLHVSALSQGLEFEDEIAAGYKGSDFAIAFNPQFIVDGLKNMGAEKVVLSFTTPANPAMIEASGDPAYQYVVMPMRA